MRAEPVQSPDTAAVKLSLRDTTSVQLAVPAPSEEESVFSDSDLKYKQQKESAPDFLEEFLNALSNALFSKMDSEHVSKTRRIIMWTAIALSVIIVIYLLSRSSISGLTRPTPRSTVFNFNDLGEDLHSINYHKRIQEALSANDFRLAIRWHYMELLFLLDKKSLIGFAPHKTNVDYRYELRDKTLQAGFAALSNIYDHVWYGQFALTSSAYATNAASFLKFKKHLHV